MIMMQNDRASSAQRSGSRQLISWFCPLQSSRGSMFTWYLCFWQHVRYRTRFEIPGKAGEDCWVACCACAHRVCLVAHRVRHAILFRRHGDKADIQPGGWLIAVHQETQRRQASWTWQTWIFLRCLSVLGFFLIFPKRLATVQWSGVGSRANDGVHWVHCGDFPGCNHFWGKICFHKLSTCETSYQSE